jgi:hypothetical protein
MLVAVLALKERGGTFACRVDLQDQLGLTSLFAAVLESEELLETGAMAILAVILFVVLQLRRYGQNNNSSMEAYEEGSSEKSCDLGGKGAAVIGACVQATAYSAASSAATAQSNRAGSAWLATARCLVHNLFLGFSDA